MKLNRRDVNDELLAFFSLPTLEPKVMDFGTRGGFPAAGCSVLASNFPTRPRYPLFRCGNSTLNLTHDFPHGSIFPLVFATHSSG